MRGRDSLSLGRLGANRKSFGLLRSITEHSQRESERQPCAQFVHRMAIGEGMTQPNIETKIIANAPNQTDQSRYRFRLAKFVFVEDLRNRPDGPLRRPLNDTAEKDIASMLAGERRLGVQVDGSPIPALRDDAGQTRTDT